MGDPAGKEEEEEEEKAGKAAGAERVDMNGLLWG